MVTDCALQSIPWQLVKCSVFSSLALYAFYQYVQPTITTPKNKYVRFSNLNFFSPQFIFISFKMFIVLLLFWYLAILRDGIFHLSNLTCHTLKLQKRIETIVIKEISHAFPKIIQSRKKVCLQGEYLILENSLVIQHRFQML